MASLPLTLSIHLFADCALSRLPSREIWGPTNVRSGYRKQPEIIFEVRSVKSFGAHSRHAAVDRELAFKPQDHRPVTSVAKLRSDRDGLRLLYCVAVVVINSDP